MRQTNNTCPEGETKEWKIIWISYYQRVRLYFKHRLRNNIEKFTDFGIMDHNHYLDHRKPVRSHFELHNLFNYSFQ